jgi:hypothetical protein
VTPNEVKLALQEVLGAGVYLNTSAFVIFVCGSFLAVALAAAAGAYFGKRGETAAVKRDLETIKESLRQTTKATEEIKADISGALWLKQKRLDLKWQCYADIVRGLGEVHTLISELMTLEAGGPDHAGQIEDKRKALDEALMKSRQSGSIARIAVAPSVRTVLTRFGDQWNAATTPLQRGIVARWGWLVVTDIARNDLFGEAREMSDEFVGDVDVKLPYPDPR